MNLFSSQYFWRGYTGYVLLAALSIAALCLYQLAANAGAEREATTRQLRSQAAVLAVAATDALAAGDTAAITELVQGMAMDEVLRVSVIDAEGNVVADNLETAAIMGNQHVRPEIQLALARGVGEGERFSQTLRRTYVYVAVPVLEEQRLLGLARVGRLRDDIDSAQLDRQQEVLFSCGLLLALVLVLGLVLAWRRAAALEELSAVTEGIAQGDFERRMAESRAPGMKRLVDAINLMARNSARRVSLLTADRNRLATIFTGMVEGVIDVDQKQNIIHINDAAAQLLGVSRERCMGKPVWQEVRNQKIMLTLDEATKQRTVIRTQVDFPREHDQLVLDLYVASLSDDQGTPIGAVLVLHDVTELRNLERVRTDFVANASHELKTPITAIRGLSETVVGDPKVDRETLMQFMERIHAQSIRLSQLVGDLMTISRLEADQNTADFALLNLTDLVTRAATAAQVAAEAKQQRLQVEVPAQKLEVFGDRQHLSQLVDNLLDNAIKYTPEKGLIQLRLKRSGDEAVLEVEDSGIGISPQYQSRVFERFYRIDKARSQSLGGTGLGLSIVKNIAERHGGNVSVNSQLGRGSVFTFQMPAAQPYTVS